jgi:hypothetical protein
MTTCIVSAYFKIPSKRPHEWYIDHVVRFFRGVRGNVVFFTTPDVIDEVQKHTKTDHVKIIYMQFHEIHAFSSAWGREFWERQYSRDRERYHSPELGAIWYEKREFIRKAMDMVESDVYIWCDAGCVRDSLSETGLSSLGQRKTFDTNDGRIHLQHVCNASYFRFYIYPNAFVGCAIISGNKSAWTSYRSVYDDILTKYDKHEISGISDQYVTQSCIIKEPDLFVLHNETTVGDLWFKFLHLL